MQLPTQPLKEPLGYLEKVAQGLLMKETKPGGNIINDLLKGNDNEL